MPYISQNADVEFNEKFQYANGDNWVTNSVSATSETEFLQYTAVTIAGVRHFFSTKYTYDGTKVTGTITYDETCAHTWATEDGDILTHTSGWHSCGDKVKSEFKTAFGKDTPEWFVPKAEIRSQLSIDTADTLFTTYIDFDEMELVSELWQNNAMLSRTEWEFHNT